MALVSALVAAAAKAAQTPSHSSFSDRVRETQPKIVKIYGAGGVRGLEPYQSGFLISDQGHIVTVWSYVLDTDYLGVTLNDGHKYEAKVLGIDPRLELAVLKIEATGLNYFNLAESPPAAFGTRVLAFSNLFGVASGEEPASVQHGTIAAKTHLEARRGVFETPYRGPIYVLDAMTNNPGAAGGALTDRQGRLVAMLGKELRNAQNNTWLNYALPISELSKSADEIVAGKFRRPTEEHKKGVANPIDLAQLGLVLVPDVLERTPPFVDAVRTDSPAARVGLQPDDLVVFVGDHLVQSCQSMKDELSLIERGTPLKLVLVRGSDLVNVVLEAEPPPPNSASPGAEDKKQE